MLDGVQTELQVPLDFVGEGETLIATGIERFARSIPNLRNIVHGLRAGGSRSMRLATDRYEHGGREEFLDKVGGFAEFETIVQREQQLEGIDEAKARAIIKAVSHVSIPTQRVS